VQNREAKRGKQALGSFLRVFKKKKEKEKSRPGTKFSSPDPIIQ
jgi:hypothetical protein